MKLQVKLRKVCVACNGGNDLLKSTCDIRLPQQFMDLQLVSYINWSDVEILGVIQHYTNYRTLRLTKHRRG